MRLEGIHHITAITGDAPGNVDFYTRVLGLRLVAKTVNQDDPSVYHLFYASETGKPGSELTFFEYPGAVPGRAGAGMVHRIISRVGSTEALDFWTSRLEAEGIAVDRDGDRLRFDDFEGLGHDRGGASQVARPARRLRRSLHADHRSLLLPLDLLPRAQRRAVRDCRRRSRLHGRRPGRGARLEDHPAAVPGGPPRADRGAV